MNLFKKKVVLYLLTNDYKVDSKGVPKNMIIFTLSNNIKDCQEYLDSMLKLKHKAHFISWCEYKSLNFENKSSWDLYKKISFIKEEYEKYHITKNFYDAEKIATIFRMFNGCPPIGCSFEKDVEYEYFIKNLDAKTRKAFEKEMEEFTKEEQEKSIS